MPIVTAGKFKTEGQRVTATAADASAQVIYTCPNNFSALVKFLNISSGAVANKKIYVQLYFDDLSQYDYLLNGYDMSAHSSFNILNGTVFSLHQKDKIVAYTDSANNFDIVVSVDEYFDPARK
jgi:hypothetical protein